MQLLQEGFQPGVHQEGVQELGKLWDELFFVVWADICKRILKNAARGEEKPKTHLSSCRKSRAGQRESGRGSGGPYPPKAQQLLGFVGTQELPQGHAVPELAPPEGLQDKDSCGCEECPWSLAWPERAQHGAHPAPQPGWNPQ